jgi:hypothetical protein
MPQLPHFKYCKYSYTQKTKRHLTRERREIDNRYKSDQKTGKKLRAIENFEECCSSRKILFTESGFFTVIDPNLASEAAQPLQLGE